MTTRPDRITERFIDSVCADLAANGASVAGLARLAAAFGGWRLRIAAAFAGAALAFAQPPLGFWPGFFLGGPLAFWLWRAALAEERRGRDAFWVGWWVGFGHFGFSLRWILVSAGQHAAWVSDLVAH